MQSAHVGIGVLNKRNYPVDTMAMCTKLNNMKQDIYIKDSVFSNPLHYRNSLKKSCANAEQACTFTQNLLIHAYWLEHYQYDPDMSLRYEEMQARNLSEIFDISVSKNDSSFEKVRSANERVVSTCRDFSLMICGIFRVNGYPARLRCGFATYLTPDHFEDHWICEYWNKESSSWFRVDAQLDDVHKEQLDIDFDPYNVPSERFVSAGSAWELCRAGQEDPALFGIQGISGLPFIKANIVRDMCALGKIETLPWDSGWGILKDPVAPIETASELSLIDKYARISKSSDSELARIELESSNLRFPSNWSWSKSPTIGELIG